MKLSLFVLVASSVLLATACGSKHSSDPTTDNTTNPPATDNSNPPTDNPPVDNNTGNPPPVGSSSGNPPPPPPATLASCISDCEKQYPDAAKRAKLIDACFTGVCAADCDGVAYSGKLYSPDVDGGSSCTDNAHSDPIAVASQNCANCVATSCCAAWTAVFGTDDGRALNVCSTACYTKFSK